MKQDAETSANKAAKAPWVRWIEGWVRENEQCKGVSGLMGSVHGTWNVRHSRCEDDALNTLNACFCFITVG